MSEDPAEAMMAFALKHGPPQRFRAEGRSAIEVALAMAGGPMSESERVWTIGTILLEGRKRMVGPEERARLEAAQRLAAAGPLVPEPPAPA